MQRCPEATRAEIELLQADGITPTLDELAALMHWGALVECPEGRVGPQPEDAPIEVGERILWPLTMAADAWLSRVRSFLPAELTAAAYGLAAERGRDAGAFDALQGRAAVVTAVQRWAATFTATGSELTRALVRLVPEAMPEHSEPPDPAEETPLLPAEFDLNEMVAATGLPLEYWQSHTSRHCLGVMRAMSAQKAAEIGISGPDPSKAAYRQLLCLVAQIRRRAAPSPAKS